VTKGHWDMHVAGGREAEYKDVCAIFQGWGKSKTTGYRGKTIYWGYLVPKMQLALLATTPMQERSAVQAVSSPRSVRPTSIPGAKRSRSPTRVLRAA